MVSHGLTWSHLTEREREREREKGNREREGQREREGERERERDTYSADLCTGFKRVHFLWLLFVKL